MKKMVLLAAAVHIIGWISIANAQMPTGPYSSKTTPQIDQRNNPDGNTYNNWLYRENTNLHSGTGVEGNPNRYLQQYQNKTGSVSGEHRLNSYSHQYNPYQFRW